MQTATTASAKAIDGQYWKWRGHDIHYVRSGVPHSPQPPLLLVHGFGASTDHWRKNIEGLSGEFEVFAIDLLGFGRSAKPNLEYSGDLWRHQLQDFITEVIGQPAVLAGNSLGGYASLSMAAQHPESAVGLILINSAGPFSDTEPKPEPSAGRKLLSRVTRSLFLQDWVTFLVFQNTRRKSVIRKTLEKVYVDRSAVTDRLVEEIYRPSGDPGAFRVFASIFRSPKAETVDRLLEQLTCPLLMLWGEGDPWINARNRGEKFRQYYPQLTEYYFNAGHCPHDEIPNEVNSAIASWVKSIQ